ncbi:MAG: UDP-3-O-[3-hydroxymyristoyl] N-acetylglucosamine deacetylase [Acidobacteriales bacterium]|nr:UDP-3-O-[3-hydroxymyristoyl] N-acetylglucosamine deacetylase [Terriglobales bacterium]
MAYEQTIRSAVECSGVGLHSGAPVNLRIVPAPAGSGVKFRRVDLDSFEVEAIGRNVAKVSYATSLMKKGVLISTTEHLLSAFIGMGVDNATVELDNLELPILDGSAQPFVEMIRQVGLKKQRKKRVYLRILKEVEIRDGEKFISVSPARGYAVSYAIDFKHPLIGKERFEVELMAHNDAEGYPEIDGDFYCRDIAAARTFGFLHEAEAMRKMGLIRGASEQNAIVLTPEGVANGPLRYPDEFVRHKVLDLLGDLALLGHRILGRVVADRAGHAMHTALVSLLLKDHSLWETTTMDSISGDAPAEALEQFVANP